MSWSRRTFLATSLGVGAGALAGCSGVSVKSTLPKRDTLGQGEGNLVSGSFDSSSLPDRVVWKIGYPAGVKPGARLPFVLSLHGRGNSASTTFDDLPMMNVLNDVVGQLGHPFAVVSVDGGKDSFFHPRADGRDPDTMLRDELLPLLKERGLKTDSFGAYGWSMGAYGALLYAARKGSGAKPILPISALALSSPGIFTSFAKAEAGAFDSKRDFAANDVMANPGWFTDLPMMICCGESDEFYANSRKFAAELKPRPQTIWGPGSHDPTYWSQVLPEQLRFLGRRVTRPS